MSGNWTEFFKVSGEYSMRNLVACAVALVASFSIIYLVTMDRLTWDLFGGYLTYGASVYGVAKWQDSKTERTGIDVDKDPPTVISDHTQVKTDTGDINVVPKRKKR